MASRNLGSLTIDMLLKTGAFDQGLSKTGRKLDKTERDIRRKSKQMQRSMDQAFGKIKFAGIAAFGAISVAVGKSVASMDQLGDVSSQLGITTEGLSELQYIAEMSGSSANNLSQGLQVLSKRLGEVETKGTGAAADAIDALGLSAEKLAKLNPEDQFRAIRKAFQGLESQSQKNAVAAHLFSRANQNLVNTLGLTDQQVQKLRKDAKVLGISISQNQVDIAGDAVDAWNDLKYSLQGLSNTLVSELAPTFTSAADSVTDLIKAASQSGAIDTLSKSIGTLANNIDILVGFFAGRFIAVRIGNFFATIAMGAKDATTAVAALRAVMMVMGGPIGVAATAVAGLGVAIYKLSGRQDDLEKSTDDVRDALDKLKTTRGDAHKDAIQAAKDAKDAAQANIIEARSIIQKWEAAKKTAKQTFNLGAGGGRLGAIAAQGSQGLADQQIAHKRKEIELLRGDLNELQRELDKPTKKPEGDGDGCGGSTKTIKSTTKALKTWKDTNRDVVSSIISDQRDAVNAYKGIKRSIDSVTETLMTQNERAVKENKNRMQAINAAEAAGVQTSIGYDELRRRSWEQMTEDMKSSTDGMSIYSQRAAENMQDAFADFLFDPLDKGFKGMLESFVDTIRRMGANLIASKLFDWLTGKNSDSKNGAQSANAPANNFLKNLSGRFKDFGKNFGSTLGSFGSSFGSILSGFGSSFSNVIGSLFGGSGGGSGWFGTALSAFSSFAGFFADGGSIPRGKFGIAGEGGRPELVTGPANVIPANKLGGSQTVVNVNNAPEGTTVRRRKEGQQEIIDVMIDDVSNGGRFYKALSGMTNVGRAGR